MQNCVVNLRSVSLPAPSTLRATSLNGPSNCAASRQVPWAVAGLAAAVLSSSTVLLEVPAHAAPQLTFASPDVKAKLEERDNNMAFKCTGGMFDCDGDRREYAKKQYANFVTKLSKDDEAQERKSSGEQRAPESSGQK